MPPLPKRKYAKTRQRLRRQHHAVRRPKLVVCAECNETHQAHRICWACGMYRGRSVIELED
ncbi:MAG: 50S ribosomal protein L32 [Chloroflexota bacterium]|nr:50S ribosomal protein L32 [Chloroflexota bacterium]MYE05921.1 50S ribosomal protein L32 [Chloroflexota bacterium]